MLEFEWRALCFEIIVVRDLEMIVLLMTLLLADGMMTCSLFIEHYELLMLVF